MLIKNTFRIAVQCAHPELQWKVSRLSFGNLINVTMLNKFWLMRIKIRIWFTLVNIVNGNYHQVCFKPVKLLLCCQSTALLLTSLPVEPIWFSCSFLFVSSWS